MKTIFDFSLEQMFHRTLRFVSTGAAIEYIKDKPVKSGNVEMISSVAVENLTSGFTKFRLGSFDGVNFQPSQEQQNPAAGMLYFTSDPIYLSELESLCIELYGCTAGDEIAAYVDGFSGRF